MFPIPKPKLNSGTFQGQFHNKFIFVWTIFELKSDTLDGLITIKIDHDETNHFDVSQLSSNLKILLPRKIFQDISRPGKWLAHSPEYPGCVGTMS